MQTNAIHLWGARAASFALAALAALSGTYWGLKGTGASSVSTAAPAALSFASLNPQAVARALGGGLSPEVAAGSLPPVGRAPYVLVGVVAGGSRGGAALISVDGKPAKPYRVGATVDGNLVLQSVTGRMATLASGLDGPAQMTLEMPPLSR